MALSAAPTPWYHPPPFVDNIRGWEDFFLNSPQSSPSDQLDFNFDFVVPPKSHGQNYPTLVSTPGIFFFCASSPSFLVSSRTTLKTVFFPTRTTNFHIIGNDATQPEPYQQSNHRGERKIPSPAPKEPPTDQGAGANDQGRLLAESRTQKRTGEGRGRTKFGHHKEGQRHPSLRHWRSVLRSAPAGYLVDVTHRYGGPIISVSESTPGSDME